VIGEVTISKWSYNLMKKQFDLPSLQAKEKLESEIDLQQEKLKDAQENLKWGQAELDDLLNRMNSAEDIKELKDLRRSAQKKAEAMRDEQANIADAREAMDAAEKELRAKARLFVWIDHPTDRTVDSLVLIVFTLIFFTATALQMKRRDKLLKVL